MLFKNITWHSSFSSFVLTFLLDMVDEPFPSFWSELVLDRVRLVSLGEESLVGLFDGLCDFVLDRSCLASERVELKESRGGVEVSTTASASLFLRHLDFT